MSESATAPEPVYVVLGEEELLVERAVEAAVRRVRAAEPEADVTTLTPGTVTVPEFQETLSPSLFAETRAVVVRRAHEVSKDLGAAIEPVLRNPIAGLSLILVHSGGGRPPGKKLLTLAREMNAPVVECQRITKPADRVRFLRSEARREGGSISNDAVSALVEAVGTDLRALSAAAGQLVADSGGTVDLAAVRQYHSGRAEVTGFVVAEYAVTGDLGGALEALRWARDLGVAHVLIADALADVVRSAAMVAGSGGGGNPQQLAGRLGLPPWKVRKATEQARGWSAGGLLQAMQTCTRLNAEVKGGAADADYALERAVAEVVGQRGGR